MPCVVEMWHSLPVTCHLTPSAPPSLRQADRLLAQLLSFSANPAYSKVPSAYRNGMPVFFMSPNQKTPVSSSRQTDRQTDTHTHSWVVIVYFRVTTRTEVVVGVSVCRLSWACCTILQEHLNVYLHCVRVCEHVCVCIGVVHGTVWGEGAESRRAGLPQFLEACVHTGHSDLVS